jgi:two-component system, OmpR family, sensor histidine kinase SenX3
VNRAGKAVANPRPALAVRPAVPTLEIVNLLDAGIGVLGALLGLFAGLMFARAGLGHDAAGRSGGRAGAGGRGAPDGSDAPDPLPPGVADVLTVLRSPAVVLDRTGEVVRATPSAIAFGLVRGDELVHQGLRDLVGEAGVMGLVRERELDLPRGPMGTARLLVYARVAPLGEDFLLLIVDDRTEARRVEEVRRDFVANVSHELKTPIGALSLLAEAVQDAAEDPDAVRHFAGQMQRESSRLTTLVQDIIDLSRLQVADALHHPEPIDLDEVVSDAVDRCRLAAQARKIEVVVGGDRGAVVFGDHTLLVTAIRNLVDNAIAYSPESTRVGVGLVRGDGIVEVRVSDQGIGIPSGEQDRIFERFYRVDQARSRATGGTGLGLSIVKHVLANHGGDVSVWSIEGQGSTFTLRLPDSAAEHADAEAAADPDPPGAAGTDRPAATAGATRVPSAADPFDVTDLLAD